jgi:hypothetical protein
MNDETRRFSIPVQPSTNRPNLHISYSIGHYAQILFMTHELPRHRGFDGASQTFRRCLDPPLSLGLLQSQSFHDRAIRCQVVWGKLEHSAGQDASAVSDGAREQSQRSETESGHRSGRLKQQLRLRIIDT